MKRSTLIVAIAAIIFLIAWFIPVVKDGTSLAKGGVPGWEAFRVALSPVWSYQGWEGGNWFLKLISIISGLTNLWFVLTLTALVLGLHKYEIRRCYIHRAFDFYGS